MVVTDDGSLAERCRSLRNLCFQPHRRFVHEELGWNYRLTNLQAAVGLAQLERLSQHVAIKRALGARYQSLLQPLQAFIQLPHVAMDFAENIYWVFGVLLRDSVPFEATEAMRRLGQRGIGTRPFFWPMHEQPVLRDMGVVSADARYPVAERMARRGFYLPSGLGLSEGEQELVAAELRSIFQ